MHQLLPGLHHWQAYNRYIRHPVDAYHARLDPPVVIDPMEPDDGMEWFKERGAPAHVLMTNRLHDRHCQRFADAFGATIWCPRAGLHEFADGSLEVRPYDPGDELPGGVQALEVGVLCPDETALLLPIDAGVLAIADAIVRWEGQLGFVPDRLLGDDPPAIKAGIRDAFRRLCQKYEFDHLLFAHGEPLIGGGKAALTAFLNTVEEAPKTS